MNVVDRSGIKEGFYQAMAREAEQQGLLKPLCDEERRQSRIETMARRPDGAGIWVFAYGSLMWNPAFNYVEKRRCRLFGYHRSFCLKTPIGRGSPDCPGLVLGLDRGGSVQGVALRIAEEEAEEELDVIWAREMLAGSYTPSWVNLAGADGTRFHAIAFVMDRTCERYAGGLAPDEAAKLIAHAVGRLGPCADYLENTVAAMDEMGISDGPMHDLRARVRAIRNEEPAR